MKVDRQNLILPSEERRKEYKKKLREMQKLMQRLRWEQKNRKEKEK